LILKALKSLGAQQKLHSENLTGIDCSSTACGDSSTSYTEKAQKTRCINYDKNKQLLVQIQVIKQMSIQSAQSA